MRPGSEERFSGHESFVCRYGWLPKLYEAVQRDPRIFSNEEQAIIGLGIGKNMVRSIRFWGEAFGLITSEAKQSYQPTRFAVALLDKSTGCDPYLEDQASLWLLHWRLTTSANLGAWNTAFQDVHEHEMLKHRFSELVSSRGRNRKGKIAESTIKQHIDIFLRSYMSGDMSTFDVLEETLGCPLQELGLIRLIPDGGRDEILQFHRGPKPGLSEKVFTYAILDFWHKVAPFSRTLSLKDICFGQLSPGVIFKLDENSILAFLDEVEKTSSGLISFVDASDSQGLHLKSGITPSLARDQLSYP